MDQSKQGMFPTKGERHSQERKVYSKGRHAEWIKSTYERGVANRGGTKGEIMALGGGQAIIGWW
jgi:hypothetical protein